KGYLRIPLSKNSKKFTKKIHRLVAQHFVENPKKFKQVNHIDSNKQNNHMDNLEWVDNRKNMTHRYSNNLTQAFGAYKIKNRWRSRIQHNGKAIHLGYFDTFEEATSAYKIKYIEMYGERPWE